MKYRNHRVEPYFTFLKNGQKTVEGRVREGKYCNIKPGDEIDVFNVEETESVLVSVKRVACYKSIKDMLTKEGVKKLLPDMETIDQGVEVYRNFYTPEQEKKFGVVAIEVERL